MVSGKIIRKVSLELAGFARTGHEFISGSVAERTLLEQRQRRQDGAAVEDPVISP
jgi:hypothetical protein